MTGMPRTDEELLDSLETGEWLESLDYVLEHSGPERVRELLERLRDHARERGVSLPFAASTPYVNTIPPAAQPPYPGSHDLERRIRNIIRWNAMIMVVRANRADPTIGGHIATYASVAALYEVALNHFMRGRGSGFEGDHIFWQAHTAPGIYARAFLEGRLSEEQLDNYRHELHPEGGLSSYPHPRLMPDFWQFPTVVDGPGSDDGHLPGALHALSWRTGRFSSSRPIAKVWAFLGDGEMDEPESMGAIYDGRPRAGPGQSGLRRQLQPAAARRSGAGQRQDHPGARDASSAAPAGTSSR